jgi:outer membrane protein assembly factor BamB
MTEQIPQNERAASADPEAGGRFRRGLTRIYVACLVAAVAGLLFIWQVWNPILGPSIQHLMTYGILTLISGLTVLWLCISSPFSRRTVALLLGIVALLGTGAVAAVRDIEFDGDMGLVVHYRWEPTAAERLAAHRSRLETTPLDAAVVPEVTAEDFPGYRVRNAEGIVVGPALSQDWETDPPELLWSQPCGGGYSSFAVVDGFLVTLEQRGASEALVCYDADSGVERWVQEYPALFEEAMGGPGPRATPTVDGAEVFSYGAQGDLLCADLATGDIRWHVRALPENAANASWAMASSPLLIQNLVIVEAGGPQGDGLVAVDRTSGETIWERPGVQKLRDGARNHRAGYSSPFLATLFGVRQVLIFDGQGLRSHVPETGEQLWFHEFFNDAGVNVAQPLILDGNRIFLSQSYGVGCRMIRLDHDDARWSTSVLWENLHMKCKFTTPVFHDGFIYGLDEGILVCLDPETGERNWKKGRYGHGQILMTNGQLIILSERGDLVLVEPDPDRFREVTKFPALKAAKVWNPHALARGIVYVRNHEFMTAYDLRAR